MCTCCRLEECGVTGHHKHIGPRTTVRCSSWQPANPCHFFITWEDWKESHIQATKAKGGTPLSLQLPMEERNKKTQKSAMESPRHVQLWSDEWMHEILSFSSAENLRSHYMGTLVDFCQACFLQCSCEHGKAHFGDGIIASPFETSQRKKDAEDLFQWGISCSTLVHSRESQLCTMESKLGSAHQILFKLTGICCCRNACTFHGTNQKSQIIQTFKIMGTKQAFTIIVNNGPCEITALLCWSFLSLNKKIYHLSVQKSTRCSLHKSTPRLCAHLQSCAGIADIPCTP